MQPAGKLRQLGQLDLDRKRNWVWDMQISAGLIALVTVPGPRAAIVEDRLSEKRIIKDFDHLAVAANPSDSEGRPNI